MDAVEFLKEYKRMCGQIACESCPLHSDGGCDAVIVVQKSLDLRECVEAVEQWAKDCPAKPVKTRQSEFLRMHPEASVDCEEFGKIIERLAAYEDTRLTPEEIRSMRMDMAIIKAMFQDADVERLKELARTDREGRVVVLPCKVGDTVYWVHNKTITRCRVYRIQTNRKGLFICLRGDGKSYGAFRADLTIGKTVFLTREEAEEALEAMKTDELEYSWNATEKVIEAWNKRDENG